MGTPQKNNDWKVSPEDHQVTDRVYRNSISNLIYRLHSITSFHLVAGLGQMILGLTVILIAIMGFIQPLWLSTALTAVASLSTMIGFFLLYHTLSKVHDRDQLLRNAMKRVMEAKN